MTSEDDFSSLAGEPRRRKDRRVPALRRCVAAALDAAALPDEAGIVVACSGGPDSTVLLDALAWSARRRRRLVVAHYRHRLHERDADMAAHVEQLAARYGLPCVIGDWSVDEPDAAARLAGGEGVEDAARRARYAFLARTAAANGCTLIATGHTLDDQAETVLMRLLSGTGLAGLQGIAPLRRFDDDSPLWLMRPLLAVRRAEVEAYLAAEGLTAVADPTNVDESRLRNRLRHTVLPLLAELNPRVRPHLAGLAEDAREAAALVEAQAAQLVAGHYDADKQEFALAAALTAHGPAPTCAALKRVLTEALKLPSRRVTRQLLADLCALADSTPGAELALPAGWRARTVTSTAALALRFLRPSTEQSTLSSAHPALPIVLDQPGEVTFYTAPGLAWRLTLTPMSADAADLSRLTSPNAVLLAADALTWPLTLRSRQPGERFEPLGAPGHKPIREMLREHRIPTDQRPQWPLLVDATGKPLWLLGIAIANAARIETFPARAVHGQVSRASR